MHPKQTPLIAAVAAIRDGEFCFLTAHSKEDHIQKARGVEPVHNVEDRSARNVSRRGRLSIVVAVMFGIT